MKLFTISPEGTVAEYEVTKVKYQKAIGSDSIAEIDSGTVYVSCIPRDMTGILTIESETGFVWIQDLMGKPNMGFVCKRIYVRADE